MKEKQQNKQEQDKKTYVKPKLTPLGDIRDVTMGSSIGITDSDGNGTFP